MEGQSRRHYLTKEIEIMAKKNTIVKTYKNEKEYQKDVGKMSKKGYAPLSVVSHKPHTSGCRYILGGFLFGRKKPVIVVTYQLT